MSLAPGSKFGHYEVLGPLGAGGMGEVHRARDSALGRDVALKILPDIFAKDPERIARFRREAQVLASLNHPHIAAIYGLAEADGVPALILEFVDGPTLAERLEQGAMPLDGALRVARQVADALEAAHQQGVVHRDLKPGNIKLRPDGTVKVLDFGLAKMLAPVEVGFSSDGGTSGGTANTPTISSPVMTMHGIVLGTPAYMSPEQALGDSVDRGTDIWAFGCVLFEMLTGTNAFAGTNATDTRAAVIRREPDWTRLPTDTPESVRRLLRRCLEKDRRRRLADVRDARLEIEEAASEPPPKVHPGVSPARREPFRWVAAALLFVVVAIAAFLWGSASSRPQSSAPEMRVEITTPPTTDMVSLALAPDGRHVAFVASAEGRPKLWIRSLESGSARPLPGTDGASFPFWSPDSRSVAFFANEKINRIAIDGGSPQAVSRAIVAAGGTWNRDGVMVFPVVPDSPLFSVADTGGEPSLLPGSPAGRAAGQRFPQFLPDGQRYLYFVAESRGVFLGTLNGPERRRLFDADAAAVVAAPDQVLFVRGGTLFAQRFDLARAELVGGPSRLADDITVDTAGAAAVSASAAGSLVFRTGEASQQRRLVWVDRTGVAGGGFSKPDASNPVNPQLSADNRTVALSRSIGGNADIWLGDLGRDVLSRFTFDGLPDIVPVWSPDGSEILFSRPIRDAGFALFRKPLAGGEETPLLESGPIGIGIDWSRDGQFVLLRTTSPKTGWDIAAIRMKGDHTPLVVAQSPFDERTAQFSPDARWIAYESNESGRYEIYVQPFPDPGAKTLVSTGGGSQPRWRSDGSELFYLAPDGRLMAVSVRTRPGQPIGLSAPSALFVARVESTIRGGIAHEYAVSADGQRFLMNTFTEQAGSPITLILNRPAW